MIQQTQQKAKMNKDIFYINNIKKETDKVFLSVSNGGEIGIRTPGSFHYNGFQVFSMKICLFLYNPAKD